MKQLATEEWTRFQCFPWLNTGDIVLFSDKYWITSLLTRLGTRSSWTHVGLVVRLPWTDDIYMWELSNSVISLHDQITGKHKTTGARLIRLADKLWAFPKHGNRVAFMKLLRYNQPAHHLHDQMMRVFAEWNQVDFRHHIWTFLTAAFQEKPWHKSMIRLRNHYNGRTAGHPHRGMVQPLEWRYSHLFCSEAIAIIYQLLGVFLSDPAIVRPANFVPGDYGCRTERFYRTDDVYWDHYELLPFAHGWHLEPYVLIRL